VFIVDQSGNCQIGYDGEFDDQFEYGVYRVSGTV